MKKNSLPAEPSRRDRLDLKLQSYSALSVAALATTAGAGIATTAFAQGTIAGGADGMAPSIISPLGQTTHPTLHGAGGTYFPVGGASAYLWVFQQNAHALGKSAIGIAKLEAKSNSPVQFRTTGGGAAAHAVNLAPSAAIGGGGQWNSFANLFATRSVVPSFAPAYVFGHAVAGNQFAFGQTGYVGFRTGPGTGHYHYGWLRVKVTGDTNNRPQGIELVPISGQVGAYGALDETTFSTPTAIPEPASVATGLALFALGAVGVREHRRRRSLAA